MISSTLLLYLIGITGLLAAQDLPKVIPPSPEVSALFKYQDWPMDYSTGLPQINIPLYEIKSGSLNVPISISYRASGRRISDQDGPIALGWSLNAGGVIGRTVHGDPDFGGGNQGTIPFPAYPIKTTGLDNVNDMVYLQNLTHSSNDPDHSNPGSWLDGEYDVFSYNLPGGGGGKFIFKDSNGIKTAVTIPYKPYVITPHYSVYNGAMQGLTSIDILDDKGVLYIFSVTEKVNSNNIVSSLLLKQIISADKTDTITFVYQGFSEWSITYNQQRVLLDVFTFPFCGCSDSRSGSSASDNDATTQYSYTINRLTEIDFNQGKVLFNLASGSDKVDNIQVVNAGGMVTKTIQLNRAQMDYFAEGGVGPNPLVTQTNNKLTSLQFKDNAGGVVETYSFQYFPTVGTIDPHYIDWWGYYNNSGSMNLIPRYRVPYQNNVTISNGYVVGGYDFNREPNLAALESGVLQKITYPTGGSSEFVYENNQYMSPTWAQVKTGPGLRIAKIITDDNQGTKMTKVYKYGASENGYGMLDLEPQPKDLTQTIEPLGAPDYMASEKWQRTYSTTPNPGTQDELVRQRTFYSDFVPELGEIAQRPVIYTTVTEYLGTPENNIGKTVYTYDNAQWNAASYQLLDNLKTMIKYQLNTYNYWDPASLLTKTDYRNDGNGQYAVRKSTVMSYNRVQVDDVYGVHTSRFWDFPISGSRVYQSTYYPEAYGIIHDNLKVFVYSNYHLPIGSKNLYSTTETTYNDDGTQTVKTTTNTYNSRQYLSQTVTNTSDANSNLQTQIKYPFDYSGNTVLTQMSGSSVNMLAFPVEQIQNKVITSTSPSTTIPLSSVRTNYYNYGSSNPAIYPQTVDVKKGSNVYETRLRYYGYDATGNPLSVSKEKDMPLSYVWDYNNTYPIAEVKNASMSDIAFTSFEADGTGNWIGINGSNIVTDANSITGGKYYTLNTTGITKTGLTSTANYIVSYWSKNGQYNVNGTAVSGWPKILRSVTINGVTWVNYEHNISGVSSVTVKTASGTGGIDELRLYPDNAQMTSYTYTPLVGVTTQSDANNRITYYEYDSYNRLKLIRDMDRNIIKTFSYQYNSATY